MNVLNAFLKFIEDHKLIAKNDRVLVTVSGGMDSVVLADLFRNTPFPYAFAHCNFQLRGEESDGDQEFVEALAKKTGVQCFVRKFDTLATASKEGISTQMAARNLRYQWFQELLSTQGFTKIATAHHKTDNLETVLFNLTKGTGIAGFHGIKVCSGNVIRPLLFASRGEIEKYVDHQHLSWREDSSNASLKYHRNLIRARVVPILKKINPNLENSVELTIQRLASVEELFLDQVKNFKENVIEKRNDDVWIPIEKIKNTPGRDALVSELLKDYGFNYSQAMDLLSALERQSGKVFHSPGYLLNLDRQHIIISEKWKEIEEQQVVNEGDRFVRTSRFALGLERLSRDNFELTGDRSVAFLDEEKLTFPLFVRKWKEGDKFSPLGMKGRKKLSDFMVDEKIPVNLKNDVYVVVSGDHIVWLIGYRIDDRYKITGETKNVLKISKVPC